MCVCVCMCAGVMRVPAPLLTTSCRPHPIAAAVPSRYLQEMKQLHAAASKSMPEWCTELGIELHDIQFQLCEFGKSVKAAMDLSISVSQMRFPSTRQRIDRSTNLLRVGRSHTQNHTHARNPQINMRESVCVSRADPNVTFLGLGHSH